MRTVGVAPGTYTLQLGSPPCGPEEITSGEWGVPYIGYYPWSLPAAPSAGPKVMLDPYGTDSALKGYFDTFSTRQKVIGYVVGAGLLYAAAHALVHSRRRRSR